jgi:hypothetical protein
MTDAARDPKPSLPLAALALALVQGLLLWWFLDGMPEDRWPARDPRVMLPIVLLIAVLPLSLHLLWPFRRERVLHLAFVTGAVVVAVTAAWFAATHIGLDAPAADERARRYDSDGGVVAAFVLPLAIAWLLAMPLLKLRLTSGRWTGPYPSLFDITWRGALTLAEAALFTGVFWLLMGLAGMLFDLLGIDGVANFISEPLFAMPATTLVGTLAIHLIGASAGMVDGLLRQLLNLLKWLLPLAGVIVIAFALALLPKLPSLLAEGQKVMDAVWLLWLVALTVLLLNAAYQSGQEPPGYGRIIEQTLRVVPPLLVIVAATALYSLALRTSLFGLTPARYWGLVTAAAALAYAVGYSIAAWAPGRWFARMGGINIALALALLAVLLLSVTPMADPLRRSIDSQARRALAVTDAEARDGALRFLGREAGAAGRARLEGIARLSDAEGGSSALRAAATLAQRPTDPRDDDDEAWLARIELPPGSPALEPGLQTALNSARVKDSYLYGVKRMMLLRSDFDGDGIPDALLLESEDFHLFWLFGVGDDGSWTMRSNGMLGRSGTRVVDLRAALQGGDFGTLPPQLRDLRVGDDRLMLRPSDPPTVPPQEAAPATD